MAKSRDIAQFAPDSRHPDAPWSFGWGFDSNGFRIVMYGPREHDSELVREIAQSITQQKRKELRGSRGKDIPERPDDKTFRRRLKRSKRKEAENPERWREEHGPAHIHVIDKHTRWESKFEIIEHYDGTQHEVRLIERNGNGKTPLTPAQREAVIPILNERAVEFIQLWREFYQDTKLGSYVTRISEKFPFYRERAYYNGHENKERYVELEHMRTHEKVVMPFDDYARLISRHHR